MFNNEIKNNFKTKFKEPIIISGKILGIKLLSTYETILYERKYRRILKYIKYKNYNYSIYKKYLKQACLVSICLYTFKNKPVFSSVLNVLKSLTPYELDFIYNQYIKIRSESHRYDQKNYLTFESVKKRGSQQILQKAE